MGIHRQEIYRKMIHISSLIYPVFYYFYDSKSCIVLVTSLVFLALISTDLIRCRNKQFNDFFIKKLGFSLRESESYGFTGATYFMLGTLCAFLFFQRHIAIISVFVLVIADSAASIIGILYGKNKLVGSKSLQGTLAFFVVTIIISYLGSLVFDMHFLPLFMASLVATIFELLSKDLGIDDNILIPIGYALVSSIFFL